MTTFSALSPKLNGNLKDLAEKFAKAENLNDVAEILQIPKGQLLYLIYKVPFKDRYTIFLVPKKTGGFREISKPSTGLHILQNKIKEILCELYKPKRSVHGFVKNKSIVTNANSHERSKFVLNVDLKDFYGSINFGRVYGMLQSKPFALGKKAAAIVAQICTHDNKLPQGAPTSPVISNIISLQLDARLIDLAARHKCNYSRYADDITFSTTRKEIVAAIVKKPSDSGEIQVEVGNELRSIIEKCGFHVNEKKVRLQHRGIRQEAAGLTVNDFTNVKREFIRQIRAMLHAWEKFGLMKAASEYLRKYSKVKFSADADKEATYFKQVVYGKLAFVRMVRGKDDLIYVNLCLKVADLDSNPPTQIIEAKMKYQKFDVFICHASEDKDKIARPLHVACEAKGVSSFLDEKYIAWGDSLVEKINHALVTAKYFIAILSDNSIEKAWPKKEINSAIAREIAGEQKFLPIIVGNSEDILSKLPLLRDKLYKKWNGDADGLAEELKKIITTA